MFCTVVCVLFRLNNDASSDSDANGFDNVDANGYDNGDGKSREARGPNKDYVF